MCARRPPCSPTSSLDLDAPPPTRRRLFSTPLQPPLVPASPPPCHALLFKVNSDATPSSDVLVLPPRRILSFKTKNSSTFNSEKTLCTSVCLNIGLLCSLTHTQQDHPDLSLHPISLLLQMGMHPSLLSDAPIAGDQEDHVGSPRTEEDMLQDYYQQALLSDGLQRIDEQTFIIQDWDETLGILEVS